MTPSTIPPPPTSTTTTTSHGPPTLPPPFTNTTPPPSLLTQGAEALLYRTTYLLPTIPAALKFRPRKPYRHPILDARLTKQRVLQEARCLVKLGRDGGEGLGVKVPGVFAVDWECEGGGAWLLMEWIEGVSVRRVLGEWYVAEGNEKGGGEEMENGGWEVRDLMRRIGYAVGAMHRLGVVHGDLTTSNLMLRPMEGEGMNGTVELDGTARATKPSLQGDIVLIDFGLASQSVQDEDRAVDLYVLERAFGSTHPKAESLFTEEVLRAYGESFRGANVVLKRLEEVRQRGRKRSMVG